MSYSERLRKSSFFNVYGPGSVYETVGGRTVVIQSFTPDVSLTLKDKFVNNFVKNYINNNVERRDRIEGEVSVFLIRDYDEDGNPAFKIEGIPYFTWTLARFEKQQDRVFLVRKERKVLNDLEERLGKYEMLAYIRFIGICSNGHLDDLPWDQIVHGGKNNCPNKDIFIWEEKKGDIYGGLRVICEFCRSEADLQDIYNARIKCRGRIAHENGRIEECNRRISVTLKTASDVYLPRSIIFVSAHPFASEKYRIFIENGELRGVIKTLRKYGKDNPDLEEIIKSEVEGRIGDYKFRILFGKDYGSHVLSQTVFRILDEVEGYMGEREDIDESEIKKVEYKTFKKACDYGYPAIPDEGGTFYLKIDKNKQKRYNGWIIQPVDKLTFYRVLIGYRRTDPDTARLIPLYSRYQGKNYFAGMRNVTEGIFIMPEEELIINLKEKLKDDGEIFAFIHTLAHGIIRFFSTVSGYSEASLRERIYFFNDTDTTVPRTGILIFALSEGGDGAAGGLVSSILREENIESLFNFIKNQANVCSRDPVCYESRIDFTGSPPLHGLFNYNEAVCHACMLVSETSCEYSNKGLSRKILSKGLP